jgi:hypothetical protein
MITGLIIPLWDLFTGIGIVEIRPRLQHSLILAMLLGTAMVARGEIGLLIIQMGRKETPFLSERAFITSTWAIILNTIVGPAAVGWLLKRKVRAISDNKNWGLQLPEMRPSDTVSTVTSGPSSRWADRRYSRWLNGDALQQVQV